jgi:hypothetical protein
MLANTLAEMWLSCGCDVDEMQVYNVDAILLHKTCSLASTGGTRRANDTSKIASRCWHSRSQYVMAGLPDPNVVVPRGQRVHLAVAVPC